MKAPAYNCRATQEGALERTVWVVDRGVGRSYQGVRIRHVTLEWKCMDCGGPRGEPWWYRFAEDGEWYTCHRWDNPCGHVETYERILNAFVRRPVYDQAHLQ